MKTSYPCAILLFLMTGGYLLPGCKPTPSATVDEGVANPLTVETPNPPVNKLTTGEKQHWFGYYDKYQTDPSGRFALAMQVDTFLRSPTEIDTLKIGIIDLEDANKWTPIGTSTAWGWQQGCMLQWIPGSDDEVIWNDRQGDRFVSRIYNVRTREMRMLPKAIYALSADGRFAVGTEFNRIQNMRPGYGYPGIDDPYEGQKAPSDIGIYTMDLATGASELIVSLAQITAIPNEGGPIPDKYFHYFNHLLVSPDSKRLIFLHRYRDKKPVPGSSGGGFITRMFTANVDGSDIFMLDPSGNTSHFIWKGPQHVTAWTKPEGLPSGFYEFRDRSRVVNLVGKDAMPVNGHNTYVPHTNYEWILNDTYPDKTDRLQTLYLYHVPTNRKVILGKFYEPPQFQGEWRCDLHPRISRDGRMVFFDSTHEGERRQMYSIDISSIVFDE